MRILIVEDEKGLIITLTDRLRSEGFEVVSAEDGIKGYELGSKEKFDLIMLDVMLPNKNGYDVCRDLRQSGIKTPILMLTAKGETVDKVVGLKLGADDYLTKPFEVMELLARIEALLRRSPMSGGKDLTAENIEFGDIRIDNKRAEVMKSGTPIELSAMEYKLLQFLIANPGEVHSRDRLLDEVWGYDAMPSTRTVDVHVAWLRQKLEDNPRHPAYIKTVHGIGYIFQG